MNLTSVELHPRGSAESAELSFRDPDGSNPYNVTGIVGLDADGEIIPRFYRGSGNSAKFYSLELASREPVLKIQLNPRYDYGESPSSLRDNLYRLIASSRSGVLDIHLKNGDEVVGALSGFVSKVESPQFEKRQEVLITIKCDDPMIRALNPVEIDVAGLNPVFTTIIDSLSTAPHGLEFQLTVLADTPSISVADPSDATWGFVVEPSFMLITDDIIYLSSEHNNKQLLVIRGLEVIQLADAVVSGSAWPMLFPGINNFIVEDSEKFEWLTISHHPAYWGV